jgi:signal transduction histidine kinase
VILQSRHLRLEIVDDGSGLPERIERRSGLDSMAERARRHGGVAEAVSGPRGGTVVRVAIPIRDAS